jgi:hypothetical protein
MSRVTTIIYWPKGRAGVLASPARRTVVTRWYAVVWPIAEELEPPIANDDTVREPAG